MKDNAIALVTGIVIASLIIGTVGVGTYVYVESEKSQNIHPTPTITTIHSPEQRETFKEITFSQVESQLLPYINEVPEFNYRRYIDSLNVKIFLVSGVSYEELVSRYTQNIQNDGYDLTIQEERTLFSVDGVFLFAQSTIYGRAVSIATGPLFETFLGSDTILITSNGLLTTYNSLKNELNIEV